MDELTAQMHQQALAAQKFTRKYFVVELDFSPASVDELEGQFQAVSYALPGGLSAGNVARLVELWGAYLGETIRRQTQAEWGDSGAADHHRWFLRRGAATVYPHQAIADRLAAGPASSVRLFFESAVKQLAET